MNAASNASPAPVASVAATGSVGMRSSDPSDQRKHPPGPDFVTRGAVRPAAASGDGFLRDSVEESVSRAFAAVLGQYEDVLQIERGPGEEGGIGLEHDGIAHGQCVDLRKPGFESRAVAPAVFEQPRTGRFIGRIQLFVMRELRNESQDRFRVRKIRIYWLRL